MKLIINGREHDQTILYGNAAILSYEGIVQMAGHDPTAVLTVTYRAEEKQGVLSKGQTVEVPVHERPIFNVADTGRG